MKSIIVELHRKGKWPIRTNRFIAWKADADNLITIKQNKVELYIIRCNGTLVGTSINEEVIIDMILDEIWQTSGMLN